MNKKLAKFLVGFLIPVVIIIILFSFNALIGIAGIVIYIIYNLYKTRTTVYSILGNSQYSKGNLNGALNWYEKAYSARNPNVHTAISYAYILLKSTRVEDAEKILTKLLEQKQDKSNEKSIKSNLALALWKKGQLDAAVEMMEDVMKDYKTSTAYGTLGYFYILKGELDRALEFNQEAYEYNSANTIILDNLGQTYSLKGEFDKAREIFEKLLAQKPKFPEAYYDYGLMLEKAGENEKALDMLKHAQELKVSFLSTVTAEDINSAVKRLEDKAQA